MDGVVIAQFVFATLLPVLACVTLSLLRQRTGIARIPYMGWQVVVGIIFGLIAIYGTEVGIPVNGATMNVRDAAPLAAGLFFGGPAGVIAGLIGGVERWFAVMWGAGEFTRVACSLGTIIAGVYAALLRKYLFDGRMPSWLMAFATGLVAEVLHLLLVFVTNLDQASRAFEVVQACSIPMISCVAISVALSAVAFALLNKQPVLVPQENRGVAQLVQSRLLVAVVAAFFVTIGFTTVLQSSLSKSDTASLLQLNVEDVKADIIGASDANLLALTHRAATAIPSSTAATSAECERLAADLDVAEINVIDANGIIIASSNPEFVGYDMASGDQSAVFLSLLPSGGQTQLVQAYQPISYDASITRKYAGVSIENGFVQVGYDAQNFLGDLSAQVETSVKNRHVGREGELVVIDETGSVISTRDDIENQAADQLVSDASRVGSGSVFSTSFAGEECYASYQEVEGYRIIALQPASEANFSLNVSIIIMAFMEVIVFAALFLVIYFVIKRAVVRNIWQVNRTLSRITGGDLDAEVNVRGSSEFALLSDDINQTVDALKGWIAEAESRMDAELATAKAIQESALPRIFPPYPDIVKFDIYAGMHAAKQVGGDFYDFFLVDDSSTTTGKLGFVIADVSGKGVPAALFMMAAKTEIRNFVESGMELGEAIENVNRQLCEGNDAGMFVTAFVGVLDYSTGHVTYVNAGHNPPLLWHTGTWEWLTEKSGLPLGLYDGLPYEAFELDCLIGDEFLLYTDGVTEAMNVGAELYGEERLESIARENYFLHPRQLIQAVRADVACFVDEAEQSDDITMLALEFGVPPEITATIAVPADDAQLPTVNEFIHNELDRRLCPVRTQNQLDIAVEELFVNVCHYAYPNATPEEPGQVRVSYTYSAEPPSIAVEIADDGIPFDPLAKPDAVTPDDVMEFSIGGLGILMAKKSVDEISYERTDESNIVRLVKRW